MNTGHHFFKIKIALTVLVCFPLFVNAQIQPHEIGFPPDTTNIYLLGTDVTASITKGQGKWYNAVVLINLLDSLAGDQDWLKKGTGTIPLNTDTAYHVGVISIGTTGAFTGQLNVAGRIDVQDAYANIALGNNTMMYNTTGNTNIAIGPFSLWSNEDGNDNTSVGNSALLTNISGSNNAAFGGGALVLNNSGNRNTGVGSGSLQFNYSGNDNVAIGYHAGEAVYSSGSNNIIIGSHAGSGFGNPALSNNLYIESSDDINPLIWGDFANDTIKINGKLGYTSNSGTPTKIAGRFGNYFSDLSTGWGLSLATGDLKVDTSKVVTQYDLTHTVITDHGILGGLGDDDHTQYALLAGRGSSQTLIGGTASMSLIGGTSTTSDLFLQTTDAIGASGADMHFKVGNNGATEAMTILNNGNIGINSLTPPSKLFIQLLNNTGDTGLIVKQGLSSGTAFQYLFKAINKTGAEQFSVRSRGSDGATTLNSSGAWSTTPANDAIGYRYLTSGSAAQGLQARAIMLETAYAPDISGLANGGIYGGKDSGDDLYLYSTSNATKGDVLIAPTSTGLVAIGHTSPSTAKLHIISTAEQLRTGYDTSNYFSTTVGSTGLTTFKATGSGANFQFNQDVKFVNGIKDKDGDLGTSGYVLTSTGTQTDWLAASALSLPINKLTSASATNTINNAAYLQEWQWNSLSTAAGLKFSSNSTAANSNTQKVLEVSLSGANSNNDQTTYGGFFSNIHTGTGVVNYGVCGEATGGLGAGVVGNGMSATPGVYGNSSSGAGTIGVSSSGAGAEGRSATGFGLSGSSDLGIALYAHDFHTSSNDVRPVCRIERLTTVSGSSDGIGVSTEYYIEASDGFSYESNKVTSLWTTANNSSRTSQFIISGIKNASSNDILYFEGDKRVRFNGRAQFSKGSNVASANDLTLGMDGNLFHITGNTQINAITTTDWQAGSEITLIFDSNPTVKNNTAGGSGTAILILASAGDFGATSNDVLKLIYDGTSWFEVSRSVN